MQTKTNKPETSLDLTEELREIYAAVRGYRAATDKTKPNPETYAMQNRMTLDEIVGQLAARAVALQNEAGLIRARGGDGSAEDSHQLECCASELADMTEKLRVFCIRMNIK